MCSSEECLSVCIEAATLCHSALIAVVSKRAILTEEVCLVFIEAKGRPHPWQLAIQVLVEDEMLMRVPMDKAGAIYVQDHVLAQGFSDETLGFLRCLCN